MVANQGEAMTRVSRSSASANVGPVRGNSSLKWFPRAGGESVRRPISGRVCNVTIEVDVTGHAPSGCHVVATDLYVPTELGPHHIVWCCVPGGGVSRGYFDLDVPHSLGEYSMAHYLSERGQIVLTIDPPGVGGSDRPDDGYQLTPRAVSDVHHFVVQDVLKRMAAGHIEGVQAISSQAVLGVGHSAGGLLVACQQGASSDLRCTGAAGILG